MRQAVSRMRASVLLLASAAPALAAWARLKTIDLPALNPKLKAAGLRPSRLHDNL